MNPERLQLKGMLVEARKQLRELDTQASGYVLIIRSVLNPYEEIIRIDTEKALSSIKLLDETKQKILSLQLKIKNLESELE